MAIQIVGQDASLLLAVFIGELDFGEVGEEEGNYDVVFEFGESHAYARMASMTWEVLVSRKQ